MKPEREFFKPYFFQLVSRSDRKDLEPQKSTKGHKSFTYENLLLEKQNNGKT
jgi:hypothetical protein